MALSILSIGNKPPPWANQAITHYQQCLLKFETVYLRAMPTKPCSNKLHEKKSDTERLIKAIPKGAQCVVLAVDGHKWSNDQLSKQFTQWKERSQDIAFLIGGPEGLDLNLDFGQQCTTWSLSPLVLPHHLARVVLIEQLFRTLSILHHHPYHRSL
jgi:23S rRNA (pseudouridine1915-N3)-methyltransferase